MGSRAANRFFLHARHPCAGAERRPRGRFGPPGLNSTLCCCVPAVLTQGEAAAIRMGKETWPRVRAGAEMEDCQAQV